MSRTSLRERFLEQLEALGVRLRDALGWQEETYWRVCEELIVDATIEAGRGRGGSVILASGPRRRPPAIRPEIVAATRLSRSGDKVVEQRFAGPLLARMSSNEKESRALAAIRDALPPKLISGEPRVEDAETATAPALV